MPVHKEGFAGPVKSAIKGSDPVKSRLPVKDPVPVNGREAALQALLQVWEEGAYTAIALNRIL